MKYYAVSMQTESSDSYVFLVKGEYPKDAMVQAANLMGEEFRYVWQFLVDAENLSDQVNASNYLSDLLDDAKHEEE